MLFCRSATRTICGSRQDAREWILKPALPGGSDPGWVEVQGWQPPRTGWLYIIDATTVESRIFLFDPERGEVRGIVRTGQSAEEALKLASRYRENPSYGTAIYLANMTLGALALRDRNKPEAVECLKKASRGACLRRVSVFGRDCVGAALAPGSRPSQARGTASRARLS
jgi:hypothetical protein